MCFRSSLNACRSSSVAKYLFVAAPLGDRVDDAADQLLDAVLALRRADLAAEILRDDDVGGLLRPGLRDLDVALLEHHLAAFVADDRRAELPFDLVERIDAGFGEEARERQARTATSSFARGFSVSDGNRRQVRRPAAFDRLLAGTSGLVGSAIFHEPSRRSLPAPEATSQELRGIPWRGDRNLEVFGPGVLEKAGSFSADRLLRDGGSICALFQGFVNCDLQHIVALF